MQKIDCLGCHRLNDPEAFFCQGCGRKIRVNTRRADALSAPTPAAQRAWWRRLVGL